MMRRNLKSAALLIAVALVMAIVAWLWTSGPSIPAVADGAVPATGKPDAATQSGERAVEVAASRAGLIEQREQVAESSTPKASADLEPSKLTQIPPTAAQQQAFIEGYCRPQADLIAKTLPEKFDTLIRDLSPSQARKLTELNRSVIWELAKAQVGYQIATYEQLEAYVAAGKEVPTQDPAANKKCIMTGSLTWAGRPGPVWGGNGAVITMQFAFTREDDPIMDRARTELERAGARFRAEFSE